jgi:DNA modification methylase
MTTPRRSVDPTLKGTEMDYTTFLDSKRQTAPTLGFDVADADMPDTLFDFQRQIVRWALRKGRCAIFADTGLGKTRMQIVWADIARNGGNALIFAPLAVAQQTAAEGARIGVNVTVCKTAEDVRPGINVANYERMHNFDSSQFTAIVLDESSILKSFDGKTKTQLVEFASVIPMRLACTATPAPNDLAEICNHAEFLGVMRRLEVEALFFTQDGNNAQARRLKGHARNDFWRWLSSWSVALRSPADIGFDGGMYDLPPLTIEQVTLHADATAHGTLFHVETADLNQRRAARKNTIGDRVKVAADMVNASTDPWIVWCDLNSESDALRRMIPGSIEVKGSDTAEHKIMAAKWFAGEICICQPVVKTPNTKSSTTKKTEIGALPNPLSTSESTEAPSESISENTCGSIQNAPMSSQSETLSDLTDLQPEKLNTPQILSPTSEKPKSGRRQTRKSVIASDCGSTGSQSATTGQCSQNKAAGALSAETQTQAIQGAGRCTSTTAIQQASSGGCFVQPVTSGSGSSETTRQELSGPPCTCGHISGHRVLISKPSIFGYGLNFQVCNRMAFVGLSDSYEQYYQAIRRCYRFGQKREVTAYVITTDAEGPVVRNIQRKGDQAQAMTDELISHMTFEDDGRTVTRDEMDYKTDTATGDNWTMMLGDSVERINEVPENSVGLMVFSPPFPGMYAYSNSARDMGNTKDFGEMMEQYRYLIPGLLRALKPGRSCAVHLTQSVASKTKDGYMGLKDFRGEVIRAMSEAGFIYYGEVCIDKCPQLKAIRTKDHGLMFKSLATDASRMHMALADYILQFRKPGENEEPIRAGISQKYGNTEGWITDTEWIEWAAPVWYRATADYPGGIRETDVLNVSQARETDDERHLCPLQLGVIERCVKLWSNPGDTVLSPFGGIGSEGYEAMKHGRKYIGIELKPSYWKQAIRNLRNMESMKSQPTLFDGVAV